MSTREDRKRLVRSFEKYIRLGLDSGRLDVFEVCARIERGARTRSAAKDVFAIWELCRALRLEAREEELKVFKKIYLNSIKNRQNDIKSSVLKYAFENYCDERTVYRRLAYVEKKYADIRESL